MRLNKILSAFVAGAMVLGTMSFPALAAVEPVEPEAMLSAAETLSGEVSLMSAEDSWIDNADTDWYNDTDTEFTLTTAQQLAGLAQLVINGNNFSGKTIKLGNDMDLAGKNWTPIGGNTKAFNGTFDGGEFSVNNMTAKNSYSYGNGFFHSLIGPAIVKNVSFNNAKVYNSAYYSGNVYGIVSGYAYGNVTFENIHVADSWVRGYGKVGAILGMAADRGGTTTVKDCTVDNADVYGVYNCATFIGTSLNLVDMTGCSYSDVSWIPYWAEKYYPVETTVKDSGEIVNGLFWRYDVWYYAAWSDLYNVYHGDDLWADVSGLTWTEDSSADGFCVNDYASIGNTQYTSLQDAIDAAADGDTVTLRRNYKNTTVSADKNITFKTAKYIMPNVVTPDSKYVKKVNTTTYSILDSESTVIDNAKTTGADVTLDNLKNNTAIDHEPDATYKVVVSTAPQSDVVAANNAIAAASDTNAQKAIFDISIKKTDSMGSETDISDTITNQKVTITLGEAPKDPGSVKVYHVNDAGVAEQVTSAIDVDGNKVSFVAESFSTYAVTYDTDPADPDTITNTVGVVFSPVSEGSNQYYITLKSLEADKKINRFMSADLVFKNGNAAFDYEIEPAANMNAAVVNENGATREYRFDMDGLSKSGATGEGITIGTITFSGYGTLDFSVDEAYTAEHSVNIVNTAKAQDNIVDNYSIAGNTLLVNDAVTGNPQLADDEKGKIGDEIKQPKKTLTVNIDFNNAISENVVAYQDMKAVISGGDLLEDIVVKLGSDSDKGCTLNGITYTFDEELTQNVAYTVTVSGAGYRTARYTVNMTEDKTLNFWNNVKDTEAEVEVGETSSKAFKNFLAGDIVKDNNINIYDLSAVVSYFGQSNDTAGYSEYAKYDLNRDGKIDSKDVAYVLVSWNK